jgi:parallel beta-helix repeat protein
MASYDVGARWWGSLLLSASLFTSSCGDDDEGNSRFGGCTTIIAEGSDTETIQTTLIEAETGDVLCFEDGTYELTGELSLTVNDVTMRGNPDDREAVLLDYSKHEDGQGKDALSVSGAGFTIEHMSIKNSRGNTIVVKGAERATFRNLKVYWDAGSVTENGAYAVYPLGCTDVLVEDCEVIGAADAGIYVGQSQNIIVRNNEVHGNVAGIEIENSDDALVTGNHVYDNTGGILVFVMPNLERKTGKNTIVEDNLIEENNRANFGEPGTTVSYVPAGTGVLVLANDGTEVRNNEIRGNQTTGVLALSFTTFETLCATSGGQSCGGGDTATDPYLSKLYVHDNEFADNGSAPDGLAGALLGDDLEDVIWDGIKPEDALDEDQLCLGEGASIRVFGNQDGIIDDRNSHVTDAGMFECTLPAPFDSVELPQDA